MKSLSKEIILVLAVIATCAVAAQMYFYTHPSVSKSAVGGTPNTQGQASFLTAGAGSGNNVGEVSATTTPVFMNINATASSTISGFMGRSSKLDIYIQATASSSASNLVMQTFSAISGTTVNNAEWYADFVATSTVSGGGGQIHVEPQNVLVFNLATSTPTAVGNRVFLHFTSYIPSGTYYQIRMGVNGQNASVWAAAIPSEPVPN